jgi:hypothetical protein
MQTRDSSLCVLRRTHVCQETRRHAGKFLYVNSFISSNYKEEREVRGVCSSLVECLPSMCRVSG